MTWTSSAKEPACHHANRGNSASSGAETHAHKTGNPPPGYQTPHSQHDHAGVEKSKIFFEDLFSHLIKGSMFSFRWLMLSHCAITKKIMYIYIDIKYISPTSTVKEGRAGFL